MSRRDILEFLRRPGFFQDLDRLREVPVRKATQALFSALCHPEEEIKWRAVTALGSIVADLARRDPESAREIIRRLLWSLNEESGSIGWGAPEALGEILARSEALAREYAPILVSYIRPDGNFLEYELLQRGVLWGIGRLGEKNPRLLRRLEAPRFALPYLQSPDAQVRGSAAWALGIIGRKADGVHLERLLDDEAQVEIYREGILEKIRIGDLAQEAIRRLVGDGKKLDGG